MAVTLCLGNSIKEALTSNQYVSFPEEVDQLLYVNRDKLSSNAELLIQLDPYDHKIFNEENVDDLISLCKELNSVFEGDRIVIEFTDELIQLCYKAAEQNKRIVALGD